MSASNVALQEQGFRDALAVLETSLSTPLVSGDMVEWARCADRAIRDFMYRWLERRDVCHREQLAQIGSEDPELLPRVTQLADEDDQITAEGQRLTEVIGRLALRAAAVEPQENKLSTEVGRVADEGLAWLTRIRRHEVALQTWQCEASYRDRGVGD